MTKSHTDIPCLPKRRTLIFEEGISSLPLALAGVSPLSELELVKSPQEIENRNGETSRIIKRLLAILERQRALIAKLKERSSTTDETETLLDIYETSQALHLDHLKRLQNSD